MPMKLKLNLGEIRDAVSEAADFLLTDENVHTAIVHDHGREFRNLKWQVYDGQIKYKIFAKIGVEHEVLS